MVLMKVVTGHPKPLLRAGLPPSPSSPGHPLGEGYRKKGRWLSYWPETGAVPEHDAVKASPRGPDPQETGALALSSVSRTASGLTLSAFRTYFPSTMKPSGPRNVTRDCWAEPLSQPLGSLHSLCILLLWA